MTQIMQVMDKSLKISSEASKNLSFQAANIESMQKFFNNNKIQCYSQSQELIALLDSSFFMNPENSGLRIFATLRIHLQSYFLVFELNLFDDNGCSIRARSQHQKTGLPKFINKLNQSSNQICYKCNPLSGQVKFTINYFAKDSYLINQTVQNILLIIRESKNQIQKILQFLEYIPPSSNKFLQNISLKMQKCRVMLLGEHKDYVHSLEQQSHTQLFMEPVNLTPIIFTWYQKSQNDMIFQILVQKLTDKLVQKNKNTKKFNWLHIQLTQESKITLKNLRSQYRHIEQNEHKLSYIRYPEKALQVSSLVFIGKTPPQIQRQMVALKLLSQRNNEYYNFMRQYFYIKNEQDYQKKYLVCKNQELTKLRQIITRNRRTISYQSRLHLCFELLSTAYIGMKNIMVNIKNYEPSYQSYDLNITNDYIVKIDNLASFQKGIKSCQQIAETCYQVLYDIKCSSDGLRKVDQKISKSKWYHKIKTIDDGESKFHGVSIINYWLKKILLDVINSTWFIEHQNTYKQLLRPQKMDELKQTYNKKQNEQKLKSQFFAQQIKKQKQYIRKMLFVLGLSYKTYSQVFNTEVQVLSPFNLSL